MNSPWHGLDEKFSQLNRREKILILIVGWVLTLFIAFTFILEPQLTSLTEVKREVESEKQTININKQQIDLALLQLKQDPNKSIDKEYQQLTIKSQTLSFELSEVVASLVSPSQMAVLLETVLQGSTSLKLVSLESLPAEQLIDGENNAGYFVHPVKIVLQGKFFDIDAYLSQLETLPVNYYWRTFDYEVEKYPIAALTLVVYTLGSDEDFIGG
jgi:MSHA biogenesis protein MshJ